MFSTLGDTVVGAHVLDLFAGSGALGIEALSRGAADAVFVERAPAVVTVLRANLRQFGIDATVHVGDAGRFVRDRLPDPTIPVFDLVLCDPPYKLSSDEVVDLLGRLGRSGQVSATATMVAERARHSEALAVSEQELHVADARTYGDTTLYYLRCGSCTGGDGTGNP
jgi:16S rRNA (guanine966-N2)-methyltransferase